ncbi:DNA-directed RNA polymerase II subunit RPB9 [Lecanosticta acicola]|uniref:DNA-directed RNA polymerase II subunit RPB9 n=1 Tax=Lecanosticta acicola TaxID=111012 RepID=A0AAI9EAZ6_9PEZI|nr:DNA-directed RNA polymerase II subunit RPB9 [Lecanosticta acicola]
MADYDMDANAHAAQAEEAKKITFKFCRDSNMLYPKEDRSANELMFACRTCQYSEKATASCIWRNSLMEDVQDTAGNVDDVAQDPTVGNDSEMQLPDAQMEDVEFEGEDVVPELCTLCGQEILCPICEGPSDGGVALEVDDPEPKGQKSEELIEAEKRERALSGAGYRG